MGKYEVIEIIEQEILEHNRLGNHEDVHLWSSLKDYIQGDYISKFATYIVGLNKNKTKILEQIINGEFYNPNTGSLFYPDLITINKVLNYIENEYYYYLEHSVGIER